MIFDVSHRTTYAYRKPVLQSQHLVHLTPRGGERQLVDRHSLLIEPAPTSQIAFDDYFGNGASILTIDEEHSEFVIHARSTVEVWAPDLPILALSTPWEQVVGKAVRSDGTLDIGVLQFVSTSRHTQTVPEALDYARPSFATDRPVLEAANDLTQRMYADFIFDSKATDLLHAGVAPLRNRRGCARFRMWPLRARGRGPAGLRQRLPVTRPPGVEKLQGAMPRMPDFCGRRRWLVDFDPTKSRRTATSRSPTVATTMT
jgi:transglutaminase-like putative cysteine protease